VTYRKEAYAQIGNKDTEIANIAAINKEHG